MTMDNTREFDQILTALYQHEIAISQLYGAYADQFPEYEDFWGDLSAEEINHASSLEDLSKTVKDGIESAELGVFSLSSIEASIERVKKLIAQVEDDDLNPLDALSYALRIEEGMIENRYFEAFKGDSPEVCNVLSTLAEDSRRHADTIRQALHECQNRSEE